MKFKKYLRRFRNPILLSSILSFIFLILNQLEIINLPSEKVEFIINSILSILILLGLVNNPDKKEIHTIEYKKVSSNFEDQDDWS